MKSKLLLLSFLMLLTVATTFAQTSASASGIAIQGIARDINNTAKTSTKLVLKFTIYYGADTVIYNGSQTLVTDAFGVFSTVINPGVANNSLIANNQAFLKIEEGTTIISDELLNHVPYAIAANNGVPTGSIMPYVGAEAPVGWLLCDGRNVPKPSPLYDLIGGVTPKLAGMFLRGAGGTGDHIGPDRGVIQKDAIESHISLVTDPGHDHGISDPGHKHGMVVSQNSLEGLIAQGGQVSRQFGVDTEKSATGIVINEAVTGIKVSYTGEGETRPVSYGVNYIIKL